MVLVEISFLYIRLSCEVKGKGYTLHTPHTHLRLRV